MSTEEIQGRMNGLSMAVEIALYEVYKLKCGSSKEAINIINSELNGLIKGIESDLPNSDFRTGSVDALRLITDRLRGIFGV